MFEEEDSPDNGRDKLEQMPIYKKAWKIETLARKIAAIVAQEDADAKASFEGELLEQHAHYISANGMLLAAKIAGAEEGDLYSIRMENAAIIRKAAMELLTDTTGLKMHGFNETEYLQLLRDEIAQFRVLFAEWVKSFDAWNYVIDRWGLFNPPGIHYDDKDPDEDVPFHPSDFF